MNDANKGAREYLKNTVLTASCEQLQLMLLDGAIRYTTRGIEAIAAADGEATFNAMDRAQRIVLELINGLRREVHPELVDQMIGLYNFVYRRLIDATLERDAGPAEEALRILRHQRETWALLLEKLARELPAQPPPIAGATVVPPTAARAAPPAGAEQRPVLCLEG